MDIDKRIKELEEELALLRDKKNTSGITQSETKELIEKWYGKCFMFDGIEEGSAAFMLESIKIDRPNKDVKLSGRFIVWVTQDSFLSSINSISMELYPCGGTLCATGDICIWTLPYVSFIWDENVAKNIDDILSSHEITQEQFSSYVEEADESCDNFDYIVPLERIVSSGKTSYEYKLIFGNL